MEEFSEVLCRLRRDAGYASSRAFYNGAGGREFFGCTYRQYLNVESGESLPGAQLLEKLAIGLSLSREKERSREFVLAYLRALCGSEDIVKLIVSALAETPAEMREAQSPLVRSMARVSERNARNLSKAEAELLYASAANYWAFTILSHDKGSWTDKDLAGVLGFSAAELRKALVKLEAAKLLAADGDGRWRCPDAGKVFRYPGTKIYGGGIPPLRRFREQMQKKRGETLLRYNLFSRASEAELRHYFPYLIQTVRGSEVCATQQRGPDTIFFEVSAIVSKILPF